MADDNDKIKISELDPALTLDNTSETVINKQVSGSWVTFKMTIATLAAHILEVFSSSSLKTFNKTAVGAINQTISNLAEDFNITAGSTYAKDDCVLYNGDLYQCINPNGTTSGTFIPADWQQVKAVDVGSGGGGGGSSTLAGLNDVDISTPTNNQLLKYNSTTQKWENEDDESGDHITLTQAEYDALVQAGTVDPDAYYFISDANGDDSQFQPVIYSTSERVIGVWKDGKHLYEITIYNAGGASGNINIAHNISNLEKCVNAFGSCHDIGTGEPATGVCDMPIARIGGDNNDIGICGVDDTNIVFSIPTAFGQRITDINVTLQYTKSTDVPGSGTWTPQGIPTHHYSTEEQVVGTWIDGSTLYERTFDKSSVALPDETWTNSLLGTTGIVIQDLSGYFLAYGGYKFPYSYYRSNAEYISWLITSGGSDINVRPSMDTNDVYAGVITIRYTKSSS